MQVHIIGGGVAGLCSAWYLREAGFEVTVVDRGGRMGETSYGNAGMIVPSHFVPLAAPGVIAQGIRWMFDASSPFYIKPRLSLDLLSWLWHFYRACNPEHVRRAMPVLLDYHLWSKQLYREFSDLPEFDFHFETKGLLMLYNTAKAEREEGELAEKAHEVGAVAEVLDARGVKALEPDIETAVRGGIFFPEDAHCNPGLFMQQLKAACIARGVRWVSGTAISGISASAGRVTGISFADGRKEKVDRAVLAAGSWSGKIAAMLGLRLPMQDGKGYSITLQSAAIKPAIPTILCEARVAITPMGPDVRIGGTLEISNFSKAPDPRRLKGILDSLPRYYPGWSVPVPPVAGVWQGYRPCSPDGLPYMGFSKQYSNLCIATGHAMMGMSLGPATGKWVSELFCGKTPALDTALFDPGRFG
ncbi:MAG: NAD(P)/FAD-dependent oxidoreductase [Saprospiraceae bacterium]